MYEQRVRSLFDVPSPRPVPPSPKANGALSTQVAPRSSRKAYEEAKLETPFDHRRTEFHTSQQDALNAQLRLATEKQVGEWERTVRATKGHIEQVLAKVNPSNRVTFNHVTSYEEGYHCTADLMISEDSVMSEEEKQQRVKMAMPQLRHLQELPRVNSAEVGVTLDKLMYHPQRLQPLLAYVDPLKPVDLLANLDVSLCSAALHEKLHYDPIQAGKEQLLASADATHQLEQQVMSSKAEKEGAVIAKDMARAGTALNRHVGVGNDLLIINERRMKMITLAEQDLHVYAGECAGVTDVAKDVSTRLVTKLNSMLQPVRQDLESCEKKREELVAKRLAHQVEHRKECLEARHQFFEIDMAEHRLWTDILGKVEQAESLMVDKKRLVYARLVDEEKFSRQQLHDADTIRAYDDHLARLMLCEELLSAGMRAASQYDAYSATMDAMLRNRVSKLTDEITALKFGEAASYCRRYEIFAFGAEECRVTNQSRHDNLMRDHRSATIDLEHATSILDPDASKYRSKIDETAAASKDIATMIKLTQELHAARTTEVQPWISYVAASISKEQMRMKLQIESTAVKQITIGKKLSSAASPGPAAGRSAGGGEDPACTAVALAVPSEDDGSHHMPHPKVSAMEFGIKLEDKRTSAIKDFVQQEQSAVEGRMSDIRKTKNEMARK